MDASADDVTRCNDVSRASTSPKWNTTQIKSDDIVTLESPSCVINQSGYDFTCARSDTSLTDDVNPNTMSLTSKNATAEDLTVLIVSARGGPNNPLGLANGDSCGKQTLSSSNVETGNSTRFVLDEHDNALFVSTPRPSASDSSRSLAALGLNAAHSNSFPVCSAHTDSRPPLLRAIGLAWSRSQELHPKEHKTVVVTRRRSSQCVCHKRHVVENLSK